MDRFHIKRVVSKNFDFPLLIIVMFLVGFGLVMIYSTSSYTASVDYGDGLWFFRKQLLSAIIGFAALIITTFVPFGVYKKLILPIYGFGIILIFMVLTPLGGSSHGASRWIRVFGFTLQPAEVVKICVILFVAFLLSKVGKAELKSWKVVGLALIPALIPALLIYKITVNMSSAIIVMGIAFAMLIVVARGNIKPYIILLGAMIAAATLVLFIAKGWMPAGFSFRSERILAWLDPESYASGKGFQTLQALYGIGSGGVWGKGLGKSMQKLGFLPEAQNDMIFSIICEELGLFGGIAILLMYILLLWRIRDASVYSKDVYGNLVVSGVFAHIAIQVILNIAVVTNTMPNTGISLPFISYGGSAIICTLAEIGLVLNVARNSVVEDENSDADNPYYDGGEDISSDDEVRGRAR